MGYELHGQLKISEEKNLNWYSPIGAWLVIALDTRAQSKFEWPNCESHEPPLEHEGSIGSKSSLNRSRKFLSLESDAWKVIFHWDRMELHSDILQKSQEDLYGNIGIETMFLVSLSTIWWRAHCCLLGQSQNSIWFWESLEKNSLSSDEIAAEWIWYRWVKESKILLTMWRELVMTMICLTLWLVTTWFILQWMTKSSASAVVILIALCKVLTIGLVKKWMCKMEVVTWFLILASNTTMDKKGSEDALSIISSKFSMCFSTFEEQGWKEKQSGKMSTIQFPGLNSLLKKEKEGKNLLHLSSTLIMGDLSWLFCLAIRWLMDALWLLYSCNPSELRMLWMISLDGREDCHSKNLPYNFFRWRWMGTSPAMALMPKEGDIWNAPVCCSNHSPEWHS